MISCLFNLHNVCNLRMLLGHINMRRLLTSALLLTSLASSIGSARVHSVFAGGNPIAQSRPAAKHRFRIRTITAGVNLANTNDLKTIESAIEFLEHARKTFESDGYE